MRRLSRHAALLLVVCSALVASSSTAAAANDFPPPSPRRATAPQPIAAPTTTEDVADPAPITLASTDPLPPTTAGPEPAPESVFERNQVVSFYGYPGVGSMGELGLYDPVDAAVRVKQLAEEYDELNGDRGAVGALHLIVDVAQANPTDDGLYIDRMSKQRIAEYVEVARDYGILLFLDLQIGWSDPYEDVQRLEWFLREPFVHLAIDPEFATGRFGYAPGKVIGALDADQVNAVQHWLGDLAADAGIPPKILVVHQFKPAMLIEPERFDDVDGVELTIDMDGYGGAGAKISGFERYARSSYAERSAFKLFYHWDVPLLTVQQVLDLDVDYVIYQ